MTWNRRYGESVGVIRILPREDVRQADVICTATTSSSPVFDDADVRPGTHINAVGAYTSQMQEVPMETVLRAKVLIDHCPPKKWVMERLIQGRGFMPDCTRSRAASS